MKNSYISLLKGVAIFLMLWGHCIQICIPSGLDFFENSFFRFIYSFHMPMFMLISGYLFYFSFEKRNLKELLKRRCYPLIQTIICCGIFIYFMTTGLLSVVRGEFSTLFSGGWLFSLSGLWFIWSVLSASLYLAFICKKINRNWLKGVLLIFGIVFVYLFPNGESNVFLYPYYVIGFFFAKYKDRISKRLILIKYAALVIFPIMLMFFKKRHYIYTTGLYLGDYSLLEILEINFYRWGIGIVGSIFIFVILEFLYKLFIKKNLQFFVCKGILYLGDKSLQVYALSTIFLSSYLSVVYPKLLSVFPSIEVFFINNMWLYNAIFTFILAIIFSIFIGFIVRVFDKLKINKVLFGR